MNAMLSACGGVDRGTMLFGVGSWMQTLERIIFGYTYIRVNEPKPKRCTMGGKEHKGEGNRGG